MSERFQGAVFTAKIDTNKSTYYEEFESLEDMVKWWNGIALPGDMGLPSYTLLTNDEE